MLILDTSLKITNLILKRLGHFFQTYRKISNIRRNKSQNLNDSHLALQSSLSNPLKPGVKSRMNM